MALFLVLTAFEAVVTEPVEAAVSMYLELLDTYDRLRFELYFALFTIN